MANGAPSPLGFAWVGGVPYRYETGQDWLHRKHVPLADEPIFTGSHPIAHCPKGFSREQAEEILNASETLRIRRATSPPDEADWIFAVHNGVLYRGMKTGSWGRAYHAFPECQTKFSQLPLWVRSEVDNWAKRRQLAGIVKKWLSKTP